MLGTLISKVIISKLTLIDVMTIQNLNILKQYINTFSTAKTSRPPNNEYSVSYYNIRYPASNSPHKMVYLVLNLHNIVYGHCITLNGVDKKPYNYCPSCIGMIADIMLFSIIQRQSFDMKVCLL